MCFQKYSSLFLSLFFFFSRLLFRVLKSDEKQKKRKEKVTEMMEEILRINTPYTVHSHPKSVVKMTATTPLPSSLKLEYFDIQGPAEKIRLALSIGKVPFEDRRIKFDEWQQLKATMPFGKVPVLTIDGEDTRVTQSDALLRYAGRLANANGVELYPQGGMAQLRTDEMVSFVDEMANSWAPRLYVGMSPKNFGYPEDDSWKGSEEHKKATELARTRWINDDFPVYLGHIKKQLAKNGGKFLCGDQVTIADCYLVPMLNRLASGGIDYVEKECVAKHGGDEITAYVDRFMGIEEVKKWYAPKDV